MHLRGPSGLYETTPDPLRASPNEFEFLDNDFEFID
jgi:hypothetical protein